MKTNFIIAAIALLAIIAMYFIGHFEGARLTKDATQEKILKKRYDSLDQVLTIAKYHLFVYDDSIARINAKIDFLITQVQTKDAKITQTKAYYEKQIASYTNATRNKLDSFLLSKYPDSASVARRGNR